MNLSADNWTLIIVAGIGALGVLSPFGQLIWKIIQERRKAILEEKKQEGTQPIAAITAINEAGQVVEKGGKFLGSQWDWIQNRFREQDEKIAAQEQEIASLRTDKEAQAGQIEQLKTAQVSYRRVVHKALLEIMNELGNGHKPDLEKLKAIVGELLNETETGDIIPPLSTHTQQGDSP